MIKIAIKPVSFCYGPTSIAISIANEIQKNNSDIEIIGIGDSISLEQMEARNSPFKKVMDSHKVSAEKLISNIDLIIIICDFDFTKYIKELYPDILVFFVDPLFWMWDEIPDIVDYCERYFVLFMPNINKKVKQLNKRIIRVIPQIAESIRDTHEQNNKSRYIIFNLGGMISELGVNINLATAMCEEMIKIMSSIKSNTRALVLF